MHEKLLNNGWDRDLGANAFSGLDSIRDGLVQGTLHPKELRDLIMQLATSREEEQTRGTVLDKADEFFDAIFGFPTGLEGKLVQGCETLPYVATPIRSAIETANIIGDAPGKTIYEIGSGLGRVALLLALQTGAQVKGIELNSDLVEKARQISRANGIQNLSFIHADFFDSDISDGDIFYLYKPFEGSLFTQAAEKFRELAASGHSFKIFSLSNQFGNGGDWLRPMRLALHDRWKCSVYLANP